MLRILLVGPLMWLILEREYVLAFLVFGVAGFTDGLDGFLARRFDWRSRVGGILDPLADKMLMFGVFLVLMTIKLVPLWLAALVIGRDVIIMSGTVFYRMFVGRFRGAASVVSKLNTALQLLFVLCVLAHAAFGLPSAAVITMLGAAVLVTSVISGLDYVRTGIRLAAQARQEVAP